MRSISSAERRYGGVEVLEGILHDVFKEYAEDEYADELLQLFRKVLQVDYLEGQHRLNWHTVPV